MNMRNENRGFSLIELIIVIIVLSVLSMSFFSFIGNAVGTYTLMKEQRTLYSTGVYIMERITRELSDATAITNPAAGTSSNTLTFTPAHPRPSETTVEFRQSGTDLYRIAGGSSIITGRNIDATNGFSITTTAPATSEGTYTATVELKLTSLTDTSIPSFVLKSVIPLNNYGTGNFTGRSFNGDYYEKVE